MGCVPKQFNETATHFFLCKSKLSDYLGARGDLPLGFFLVTCATCRKAGIKKSDKFLSEALKIKALKQFVC